MRSPVSAADALCLAPEKLLLLHKYLWVAVIPHITRISVLILLPQPAREFGLEVIKPESVSDAGEASPARGEQTAAGSAAPLGASVPCPTGRYLAAFVGEIFMRKFGVSSSTQLAADLRLQEKSSGRYSLPVPRRRLRTRSHRGRVFKAVTCGPVFVSCVVFPTFFVHWSETSYFNS